MAVSVREGIDYRLLEDDYRSTFKNTYKPKKDILGREYYICIYCGEKVYLDKSEMQVDHIIPKTRLKAGILWNPNKAWNLGASCQSCNASKSNNLDSRVLIGFRNKMLSNFGLIIADKNDDYSENQKTTALISIMIALVSFFALVIFPVFGMVALGVSMVVKTFMYILKAVVKFIRKKFKRTCKRLFKKFIKKPIRSAVVLSAIAYVAYVSPEVFSNFVTSVGNLLSMFSL